jgi:ATP-dependent Clp protease ATP-binding subunit ClpA
VDLGPGQDAEIKRRVMEAMKAQFRPEFLNRVDEVIIFHQLTREHLMKIVDIQLASLKKRLADRHIDIELTEAAKEFLVKEGYDPVYGARPLKRTIQRLVLDPLAVEVLRGGFRDGDTVVVDAKRGSISFAKKKEAALSV